jgi:hypothetical protein
MSAEAPRVEKQNNKTTTRAVMSAVRPVRKRCTLHEHSKGFALPNMGLCIHGPMRG